MKNMVFLPILFAIISITSGCMTFNNSTLQSNAVFEPAKDKPTIVTKVANFTKSTNGSNGNVIIGEKLGNALSKDIMNRWKQKDLVEIYNIDSKSSDPAPDYSLILSGDSDEQFSPFASALTGATLFLIPSWATVEQSVKVDLVNHKTSKTYSAEAKASSTYAMHLALLPFFIFQNMGITNMHNDMADYFYNEFYKQGAFN